MNERGSSDESVKKNTAPDYRVIEEKVLGTGAAAWSSPGRRRRTPGFAAPGL